MNAIGKKLGVGTRTLQRRLQEEGSSFQHILDAVRTALADHFLRKTMMSSAEISLLLGFEDANSFVRAFRGWTGSPPQSVRRQGEASESFSLSGYPPGFVPKCANQVFLIPIQCAC
ncbi:helix-turn-helix domain-containing protein [Agrobacterium tumefaciens]|uniref:helix-turn-helix domain-containing protein n=1 Tax=Agrobacterium tumefaciens TaxID=358 RepID=UPI001F0A0D3C|nr:helix-turn-helix domain-containing protein [Agrobacterium tumefaciens]